MVGEKGKLFAHEDYCDSFDFIGKVDVPKVEFTKSPRATSWNGFGRSRAARRPCSNFPDYAGGLAETILLGNLAVWTADKGEGKKIEWDAKNLKATNAPEVESMVKPTYRPPTTCSRGYRSRW